MNGLEKFINQVICCDALEVLRKMPDESIHLGITLRMSTFQVHDRINDDKGG
jgi:DNA modification methylase